MTEKSDERKRKQAESDERKRAALIPAFPDERWCVALDALEERNDPRELMRILVVGGLVPEWVREELTEYYKISTEQPPPLPLSQEDRKLLIAARAYRHSGFQPREKREHKIVRIAEEHGVKARALQSYLDKEGHVYIRIRDYLRELTPSVKRKHPSVKRKHPSV